jgi:hypothetical protein
MAQSYGQRLQFHLLGHRVPFNSPSASRDNGSRSGSSEHFSHAGVVPYFCHHEPTLVGEGSAFPTFFISLLRGHLYIALRSEILPDICDLSHFAIPVGVFR